MQRRRFTTEYKQEAVQLAQQSDIPISQVAKNLGINDNVLRRWIKEFTNPSRRPRPGCSTLSELPRSPIDAVPQYSRALFGLTPENNRNSSSRHHT
ncbi:MAG: transposase [Gammaproteobacteria bacterium]|nr:hypothetical protein [Rhodospirillales bacterium]